MVRARPCLSEPQLVICEMGMTMSCVALGESWGTVLQETLSQQKLFSSQVSTHVWWPSPSTPAGLRSVTGPGRAWEARQKP